MASQRLTSSAVSTLGRKISESATPTTASRSLAAKPVSKPVHAYPPVRSRSSARIRARRCAFAYRGGTESSRSKMKASDGRPIAFSRNFSRLAGT